MPSTPFQKMMPSRAFKKVFGVSLCLLAVFFQGCTKDKAEAIKVAAESFRSEASAAFEGLRGVLKAAIAMPPLEQGNLVDDLSSTNFTVEMLQALLTEDQVGDAAAVNIDQKIDELVRYYHSFAEMFGSLPRGHFFAKDAVARAERHAVNLTVQLINLARLIQDGKIAVRLNGKRILLVEQIQRHNTITDASTRREHLKNAAQQILALAAEEAQLRKRVMAQCLKAAEAGRLLTDLIRHYQQLSLGDILTQTQQSLGFVAAISGQNPDVIALLDRFNAVHEGIKNDPYWQPLLDQKLELNPTR